MMNEKWEEQFREQIHDFVETIGKFDKGEIDRKAYKGISGGFGSYAQRDPSKHMLRLRMAGGNLTEKRLEFLTEAVKDYGVELMKLTTCETVQLHNLKASRFRSSWKKQSMPRSTAGAAAETIREIL